MFGELLLALVGDGPGSSLQVTIGEVACPDRVVDVAVVNPAGADAFYELRADDRVLRTEFIAAGSRLDSRVFLTDDGVPLRITVRDGQGVEVGAAVRTAQCGEAAAPGAEQASGQAPQEPAEGATPPTEAQDKGAAPDAAAPQEEPPGAGTPDKDEGAAEGEPPSKAEGEGAGGGKGKPPMDELPYTGHETAALGRTGGAVLLTGGILLWYGRLWPRAGTRPCTPGTPRRRDARA
ncbi:hypothetical protein [Actinocorallia sp. A-T 12471]|uniref:hypothetical protein n=1 Tax=Actinocorallia sp. A-T 12471 TaxID=3089813 RepID=UPI0029CE21BD|nr:hypothetical protein [Actinocorallia sp. A-T 12471]MDX6743697.1 hypothetical protein [Actinocorallia sp. A-T 12471]